MNISINDIAIKIKGYVGPREKDLFIGLLVLLVAILSFSLGRLSKLEESKVPVSIEQVNNLSAVSASPFVNNKAGASLDPAQASSGQTLPYVASKNSTKYHRVDCAGAKSIKEANKIWFQTVEEARQAGLTPAGNCPGLQ